MKAVHWVMVAAAGVGRVEAAKAVAVRVAAAWENRVRAVAWRGAVTELVMKVEAVAALGAPAGGLVGVQAGEATVMGAEAMAAA